MSWLLAEVLATDRRQSLDGLGLAEIAPRLPARFDPPASLVQLGLSEAAARGCVVPTQSRRSLPGCQAAGKTAGPTT
jgi:hypothetical protein